MIVMGIDPGLESIGIGVLKASGNNIELVYSGLIKTDKKDSFADRLREIYLDISVLIDQHKPNVVCIEKIFFHFNVSSAMQVAHAKGCILAAISVYNLTAKSPCNIEEYVPSTVKMQVSGDGKANKNQMRAAVQNILGLDERIKDDNTNDGVAIALTYALRNNR